MRARVSLVAVLGLMLAACEGDPESGPSGETDPAGEGSSGGDAGDTDPSSDGGETSGNGETSDDTTTDSGTLSDGTSGEATTSAGETGSTEGLEVLNVASAASAMNGDSLSITDYTAPADGVLVVRGGAAGPLVQSVTFGGEPLTVVASHEEPDYWFAISADMYWIPVSAGQSGDIVWQYQPGEWTTRRRGMIAVTIGGVDEVHVLSTASDGLGTNEGRTGPSVAELEVTTTQETVILSAMTSNGPGPSDLLGSDHALDAFPTIPIEDFHSTRVYGGHAVVGPGTHTIGYQNNEANGWFDYIVFLAAFSSSG